MSNPRDTGFIKYSSTDFFRRNARLYDQFLVDLPAHGGEAIGGAGSDVLFFEMGDGSASFDRGTGGGWTDAIQLNAPDTNGVITFSDGSELIFEGVERIEW